MAGQRPELKPAAEGSAALASQRVRGKMAERIGQQGVRDPRVLQAMATVPRHLFVDAALASRAYEDSAMPIGYGQTISRPYIVARCAELLLEAIRAPQSATILEIGTGCGYAAAVLAQLFGTVVTVERLRPLHELARANLRPLRLPNLRLVFGDGSLGVPGQPPFDGIVAAAAGAAVPPAWLAQLRNGGRLVAPLGVDQQRLVVAHKDAGGRVSQRTVEAVRFVPLKPGTG
ncbi:MAG: protein-L-isoaspartate O-methyltransferase [Burkholderiaceae bacterium]|nr:protein-L-isoaspartate O-methyltransferase [Burkholderiaceae bacterium]